MGEYAEMMLDGTCCAGCGEYLGDGNGFPEYCGGCQPDYDGPHNDFGEGRTRWISVRDVPCEVDSCTKKFGSDYAMRQHMRDAHGIGSQKKNRCPECNKALKTPRGVQDHLRDAHGIGPEADQ